MHQIAVVDADYAPAAVLPGSRKDGKHVTPKIAGFRTRRVNFTFRYVPDEHVVPLARLSAEARADVEPYVRELAARSPFWRAALAGAG